MRALLILITAMALLQHISGQTATGKVYADLNKNGTIDKGEKGIPGVGVSNGREVVLTDNYGTYRINLEENTILFVIKPADYSFPRDARHLPQFYYRHYPAGSDVSRFANIEATGPLPAVINFGLQPDREDPVFKAVIFGDTQVRNLQEIDYLSRDIVAELAGN